MQIFTLNLSRSCGTISIVKSNLFINKGDLTL